MAQRFFDRRTLVLGLTAAVCAYGIGEGIVAPDDPTGDPVDRSLGAVWAEVVHRVESVSRDDVFSVYRDAIAHLELVSDEGAVEFFFDRIEAGGDDCLTAGKLLCWVNELCSYRPRIGLPAHVRFGWDGVEGECGEYLYEVLPRRTPDVLRRRTER